MLFSSCDLSVKKIKSTRTTGESVFRSFLHSMALNANAHLGSGRGARC